MGSNHFRLKMTTSGLILIQKWIQDQGGIWQCVIEPSQAGNTYPYHMCHKYDSYRMNNRTQNP